EAGRGPGRLACHRRSGPTHRHRRLRLPGPFRRAVQARQRAHGESGSFGATLRGSGPAHRGRPIHGSASRARRHSSRLLPPRSSSSPPPYARKLLGRLHHLLGQGLAPAGRGALRILVTSSTDSRSLVLDGQRPLTPADIEAAAQPLSVPLSEGARAAVARCAAFVRTHGASGKAIYGLSTGFGPLVTHAASSDPETHGIGLLNHLRAGQGDVLAPR